VKNKLSWLLFGCSFFLVAFGQPSWLPWLAPIAAFMGFALFWSSLYPFQSKFLRFALATFWFTAVQLIQLSWMTSIEYQGVYMLFGYFWLASWLGVQFGLLTCLLPKEGGITFGRILGLASLWTLFEWSRFFFLCGFSWNPSGLALAAFLPSIQMASLGGVLGLSFWVMLMNGFTLKLIEGLKQDRGVSFKAVGPWLLVVLFPYLFGVGQLTYQDHLSKTDPGSKNITVALVQTGLLPPEKLILPSRIHHFVSPWEQWRRILAFLKLEDLDLDLIVLPEVAVPFQCDRTIYPYESVVQVLRETLGEGVLQNLPPLTAPFAEKKVTAKEEKWMVSNSFWTQAVANYFDAEVVIGLEDEEKETNRSYNAAFHFVPNGTKINRYEKQVLLPIAEYLPSKVFLPFMEMYGIRDFFTKGEETKIFKGRVPFAISICYEETFPDLVREGKLMGAEVLVNVTNDNWYPNSKLPQQHFDLGRLRAVENGIPLLRACNTGISAVIDNVGRPLCMMGELDEKNSCLAGALVSSVSLRKHSTLYTLWGDGGIVGLSLILLGVFWRKRS
jgi:apolipoprotein N-acyltransferase